MSDFPGYKGLTPNSGPAGQQWEQHDPVFRLRLGWCCDWHQCGCGCGGSGVVVMVAVAMVAAVAAVAVVPWANLVPCNGEEVILWPEKFLSHVLWTLVTFIWPQVMDICGQRDCFFPSRGQQTYKESVLFEYGPALSPWFCQKQNHSSSSSSSLGFL